MYRLACTTFTLWELVRAFNCFCRFEFRVWKVGFIVEVEGSEELDAMRGICGSSL